MDNRPDDDSKRDSDNDSNHDSNHGLNHDFDNKNGGTPRKNHFAFVFCLLMALLLGCFFLFGTKNDALDNLSYSQFITAVKQGRIAEVVIIDGTTIRGAMKAANSEIIYFQTIVPYIDSALIPLLAEHNVQVSGSHANGALWLRLLELLPIIILIIIMIAMMRQNALMNSRGMQFGRSRARIYRGGKKITFADVAGQAEVKRELADIIDFLKNPKKYVDMGAKIPTGVLLVGSPGTGKTLLARAVAGEAGVAFLHISGSDFVEMFVGVGASRVRDLFLQARRLAPAIIFIDELDAVARARGAGLGGGHDEREQTLNQMLVEMDGFETKDGVIVLAATNRPDVLDPAMLRPGRFDRQVHVSLPDIKDRLAILEVHVKKIRLTDDVDLPHFARSTSGMSGADLANVVNEAALLAAGKNVEQVSAADFERARDKIIMGVAREAMVIPEKERKMTAVHEAGHALPHYFLKNVSPLHKVTIVPRGRALGLTVSIPAEDSYSHTRTWFEDQLVVLFGGYAAETLVYGDTTTGTQNDIQRATEIARRMVCEWGMADEIGAICYGQEDEPIFMGREITRHKMYSEETARSIDVAVKKILDAAYKKTFALLKKHRTHLSSLAAALVEQETMTDSEIRHLLGFANAPMIALPGGVI